MEDRISEAGSIAMLPKPNGHFENAAVAHPNLKVVGHSLGSHIVTHLRDKTTSCMTFRTLSDQLSTVLALKATEDLETVGKQIETPLETCRGSVLIPEPIVIYIVLRAGLAMMRPFLQLFPDIRVGFVGLERDHDTAIARNYYEKSPRIEGRRVFVLDPMLATGGSAVKAIDLVKKQGATQVSFVCVIAAPNGLKRMAEYHPDVPIVTAAVDPRLNSINYIEPGLGDYGDRYFGTDEY